MLPAQTALAVNMEGLLVTLWSGTDQVVFLSLMDNKSSEVSIRVGGGIDLPDRHP